MVINMNVNWLLKAASWIPAIIMAFIIGGFSGQDSVQSQGLSDRVAGIIVDAANAVGIIDTDDETRAVLIEKLQFPIRKGAHMTEYAVFTCTVMFALYVCGLRSGFMYLTAVAVTFVYAASDEIHQLFVPGRSGQFTDVLIDTAGGIIAATVVCLFRRRFKKVRLDRTKSGNDEQECDTGNGGMQ